MSAITNNLNLNSNDLHLNWSLSHHIRFNHIDEAKMVIVQMSITELEESLKSCKFFQSTKANIRKFKARYEIGDTTKILSASEFLKTKQQLIQDELNNRK